MVKMYKNLFLLFIGFFFSLSLTAHAESVNALFHRSDDPVLGNPKGKVTVVEFFDYQCSHCVSMAPIMQAIIKANPDVRIVYKELPIRGAMSEFAARAALAANKQGKYYDVSHAILSTTEPLTQELVMNFAKNAGLSMTKLKQDMNSASVTKQLRDNANLAQEMNVNGTPAFFIGKTNATNSNNVAFVLGEMSESELQDAINKASHG